MSKIAIDISKNKERNKEKTINLQLSKLDEYAIIKFQSKKIKELFTTLFKDVYFPNKIHSDVTIVRYDSSKFKLSVVYSFYHKKINKHNQPKDIFYKNTFYLNGDEVKIFTKNKQIENEETTKSFFKSLYKAEYEYYKTYHVQDIEETICDFETFMKHRENFILLIEAYIA